MDYSKILGDETFFEWHDYAPADVQYVRYAYNDPSVIAAGHKIEDVFFAFANARASFLNADSEDFGDISGEDALSKLYAKTHFLTYALIEYAICIDISWQVIWAYFQPGSFEYLIYRKYVEMEKECTSEAIHNQLNCAISQGGMCKTHAETVKQLLTDFENDEDVIRLRSFYNRIKHRGMIHFEGMGANYSSMSVSVNGKTLPILSRPSCTVEEIENLLHSYHFKFEDYFNVLLATIMPADYKEQTVSVTDYFNTLLNMHSLLEQK